MRLVLLTIFFSYFTVCFAADPQNSQELTRRNELLTRLIFEVKPDVINLLEFANQIVDFERTAGGPLEWDLVKNMAEDEIRFRNAPASAPSSHCFTGDMRVLTPKGYVPISQLKVGDQVISWDTTADKPVTNSIEEVFFRDNKVYGRLCDLSVEGRVINVTAEHPFYVADSQTYQPIEQIRETSSLLRVKACESSLIPRGRYQPAIGTAPVFTLKLKLSPHNFILEGILVHNKPGHVT